MKKFLIIVSIAMVAAWSADYHAVSGAVKSTPADEVKYTDQMTIDIDRDGRKETITLVKKQTGRYAHDLAEDAYLQVERNGVKYTKALGEEICFRSSGVEGFVDPDEKGSSFAGVISHDPYMEDRWKLILFSFDGKEISHELTLYSSHPDMVVDGKREDGKKVLVVTTDDYDNDPAMDKFVTTYEYTDGRWKRASILRTKTGKYLKAGSGPE